MPFIVKIANTKTGDVAWLAVADGHGFHTLATREMAATFETIEDAKAAINETRKAPQYSLQYWDGPRPFCYTLLEKS